MHELGHLGRRLLAAFVGVALVCVLLVTVAALIGSQRGIAASAARQQVAVTAAELAARAYEEAGGWQGADLQPTVAYVTAEDARVQIWDERQTPLLTGMGRAMAGMGGGNTEPVVVQQREVGTVRVGFGTPSNAGQGIAWTWILVATVVAVAIAVGAGWWVAVTITRPLRQLTAATAAFAAGDRDVRAGIAGPGEIGELARTFDEAADTINRQEASRRNLSADVAHELRTPLTALLAGLEEVRDGFVPADEPTLTRLHDQASRLGRVVDDLAALAAAEAPLPVTRELMDLSQAARNGVHAQSTQLKAAGVVIKPEVTADVPVMADPDRMTQVVSNLLSNCARYCRPGDSVVVRTYRSDGQGVLEVSDTGPGVPAADLEHIFERFWRGSTAPGGSGIGLAVVRELVSAQDGTVSATSEPAGGLTVQIRLPGVTA